jgi:hypothetical protein
VIGESPADAFSRAGNPDDLCAIRRRHFTADFVLGP